MCFESTDRVHSLTVYQIDISIILSDHQIAVLKFGSNRYRWCVDLGEMEKFVIK